MQLPDYRIGLALSFTVTVLLAQTLGEALYDGNWILVLSATALIIVTLALFKDRSLLGLILGLSLSLPTLLSSGELQSEKSFIARVETIPKRRQPGGVEISARDIENHQLWLCKAPDLPWKNASHVEIDDVVTIWGTRKPLRFHDQSLLSRSRGLRRDGYAGYCSIRWLAINKRNKFPSLTRIGYSLQQRIQHFLLGSILPTEGNGLFFALTLGTRDQTSNVTEKAFKTLGLAHLLVLPGAQLTLLYLLSSRVISKLSLYCSHYHTTWLRYILTALAIAPSTLLCLISGIEKPALRALVALSIVAYLSLYERRATSVQRLLLTILLLVASLGIPWMDISLQLTFAALIGIQIGLSGKSWYGDYLWVNTCAVACTGLITLIWFDQWNWISLLMNPLLAPLLSVIPGMLLGCLIFFRISMPSYGDVIMSYITQGCEVLRDAMIWLAQTLPCGNSNNLENTLVCLAIISVGIARTLVKEHDSVI